MGILLLARGRGFELLEHLVGQFIGSGDGGVLLAEFFHFIEHPFEHFSLMLHDQRSDDTPASADNSQAFLFGAL